MKKDPYDPARKQAEAFYGDYLNMKVDVSGLVIPAKPKGLWRLRFVAEGLTNNQLLSATRKHCKVWTAYQDDDLDTAILWNKRTTQQTYAVWLPDSIEPPKKYLGKSPNEADPEGLIGVTLLERMLDGFQYFMETKQHLDIRGGTFCTGSRDPDGSVPYVYWFPYDEWVYVCDVHPDDSVAGYGLRPAVA